MKKLFYILAFSAMCSLAITSCTEDEVTPTTTQVDNGGGGTSDGPKP